MRSIPEGIRTHDNPSVSLRLPAPLHRGAFGASVGVDLRSTRGRLGEPPLQGAVGLDRIKKHPCLSRDKGAHLCGTTLVAKRPLFGV